MLRRLLQTAAPLLVLLLVGAQPVPSSQAVQVADSMFDWTDIEEDRALFEWSAEVVNEGPRESEVRVTLVLLDADDEVVCWTRDGEERCARDSVDVTVEGSGTDAPGTRTVQGRGSIPYDRAAEVVSFRFRVDPLRAEEP